MRLIYVAIEMLVNEIPLPGKYRDHALVGNWKGFREIHIAGDVLLIYQSDDNAIIFVRLGTHDDLF